MAAPLLIIPQKWVDGHRRLPEGWLEAHAPALLRYRCQIPAEVEYAARMGEIDERLLVCIMQREQSAITYAWDNSAHSYPGGDRWKLTYLCGVDRMDGGNDRVGGWFGPRDQLLGCALRFGWWYHGQDGQLPGHENWLHLTEDPRYQAGVPVTRGGVTIIPANWASAQSLRYCTSMSGQDNLRAIGLRYFAEDYAAEESAMIQFVERTVAWYEEDLRKAKANGAKLYVTFLHNTAGLTKHFRGKSTLEGYRYDHMHRPNPASDILCHCYTSPQGTVWPARSVFVENCGCQYPQYAWGKVPAELRRAYEEHPHGWGWREWVNGFGFSVETAGNYDVEDPTQSRAMATSLDVLAAVHRVWNIPVERCFFHRDVSAKSCPGNRVTKQWVHGELRKRLEGASVSTNVKIIAKKVVRWPGYEPNADLIFHDGRHYMAVADVPRLLDEVELIDRREEDGKLYLKRRGAVEAAAEPTALAEGTE